MTGLRINRRTCLGAIGTVAGMAAAPVHAMAAGAGSLVLLDPTLSGVGAPSGRVVKLTGDVMRVWRDAVSGQVSELRGITRWSDFVLLRELARDDGMRVRQERYHRGIDGALAVFWSASV